MALRTWEVSKICFCEHIKREVALEIEVVYPADILPESPRVLSHRCSEGLICNQFSKPACVWAGTNPEHDPFHK